MKLTSLTPSQKVKGRWLALFADGSKLKLTDLEVADFHLRAGLDIPEAALEQLRDAAGASAARRRAVNILSARPMSRKGLVDRLVEKGETPAHAEAAADYAAHLGYLDDRAYAETVVRHYAEKGYGPRKLRDELYRRGVPREYWDQALAELEDSEAPREALDALVAARLRRVDPTDRADLKRVCNALIRRGYSWSDFSAALRRYTDALED